jgi:putative SOS response-associated peptidase YedK
MQSVLPTADDPMPAGGRPAKRGAPDERPRAYREPERRGYFRQIRHGAMIPAMCRRFFLTATAAEIRKHFKVEKVPDLVPRYNIAPTQTSPILVTEGASRQLHVSRWGLVPSWSRDLSLGAQLINVRADTIEQKSTFSIPFQSRRCLVPANGFYEWQQRGAKKQPYKIALRGGALIAFAGLWERWAPEDGNPIETFTIITTEASRLLSEVHDRMPVIIAPTDYQRWLTAPVDAAKKLLVPYRSGLTIVPVSERINSIQIDDVGLITAL